MSGGPILGSYYVNGLPVLSSGPSGGIPYWATPTSLSSTATLTYGQLIVGGGYGNPPFSLPPGTSSQVLIGGPSWGQVNLAHMVTGNLSISNLNTGMNASSYSYWRGDGTWAIPAGAGNGNVNNYSTPLVGQVAVWMDEYTIQGLQTLPITAGGTGQNTAQTGFDALSPMANPGDMLYGGAGGDATVLPAGTSSQVLFGGTAPHWGTVTIATVTSANITDATALGREILTSSSAITTLGYLGRTLSGLKSSRRSRLWQGGQL